MRNRKQGQAFPFQPPSCGSSTQHLHWNSVLQQGLKKTHQGTNQPNWRNVPDPFTAPKQHNFPSDPLQTWASHEILFENQPQWDTEVLMLMFFSLELLSKVAAFQKLVEQR